MTLKGLAGSRKIPHVYSYDIVNSNGRFLLSINNRHFGMFSGEKEAQEALQGVIRNTSDSNSRPSSIVNANAIKHPLVSKINKDLIRRYYSIHYLSTNGANPAFFDWNEKTRRTFLGSPSSTAGYAGAWRGARAYPFEFDPVNPASSSPWHNIIYEHVFEHYKAGFRAFHFHFPFGGYAFSWLGTPIQWLDTNASLVDAKTSQAMVVGFSEAIKALLSGTMTPSGRPTQITEPCDVLMYTNGACGFKEYRDQLHALHASFSGTTAQKDAQLLQFLDRVADLYIACLPSGKSGVLTMVFDTAANSATPACISHHRSLPDYVSDTCELADWYVSQRLAAAGIKTMPEARPRNEKTTASFNSVSGVSSSGSAGDLLPVQWSGFDAGCNWGYFSDPESGDAFYANYKKNDFSPHYHIQHGSYLATNAKLQARVGVSTVVQNGAAIRDLNVTPSSPFANVYTPHHVMVNIYTAADVYMDHMWRIGDTAQDWEAKRVGEPRLERRGS